MDVLNLCCRFRTIGDVSLYLTLQFCVFGVTCAGFGFEFWFSRPVDTGVFGVSILLVGVCGGTFLI